LCRTSMHSAPKSPAWLACMLPACMLPACMLPLCGQPSLLGWHAVAGRWCAMLLGAVHSDPAEVSSLPPRRRCDRQRVSCYSHLRGGRGASEIEHSLETATLPVPPAPMERSRLRSYAVLSCCAYLRGVAALTSITPSSNPTSLQTMRCWV
jgi:hypothetical protein